VNRSALVLRVLVLALVVMPVSAVVFVWAGRERIVAFRHGQLPVHAVLPDFALTEASDRAVGLADLRGQVWVAGFIFTRCAGTCPIITHYMGQLQELLPARADLKLVSFSVDPEYDTPAVLRAYARQHRADPTRWWFLTGPKAEIYRLTREAFRLTLDDQAGTPEEPVLHSAKLVLVDRAGQVRGYYDGTDMDNIRRLARDARRLAAIRT
jgi:protein SCO1/2